LENRSKAHSSIGKLANSKEIFAEIKISKDFSQTPGPRSRDEGDFSGQEFLEDLLLPKFEEIVENQSKLLINLDGTDGYATSFLESAFGGLSRHFKERLSPKKIIDSIVFISLEEPYLVEEIKEYIRDANKK
jgi:hypothetical protein